MTDKHEQTTPAAGSSAPNRTPAIVGFLIVGALILGVSFFVTRLDGDAYDDVPPISISAPASGDTLRNPVTIEFRTPADLHFDDAMGWIASDMHLHAMVDSIEIMPAAADIAAGGAGWSWRLPALGAGNHRLYLTWAGRHHGNLRGQTDTVSVHVEADPEPTLQNGPSHH